MSFLGYGFSPFGYSPFGFGAVPTANSSVAKLFKKPDGTQGNAPLLDPATYDYVLDAGGNKVGADSTLMMVQFALTTIKGSASDPLFGLASMPGVFTPDVDRKADTAVRSALKHMTSKKLISIQRVSLVRHSAGAASIRVDWIDLNTGEAAFYAVSL